jgi:hypothetical protein
MIDDILATLIAFAAGEIQPEEFRDRLYTDDRFEVFLENDPHLERINYVNGSTYQFLLNCDFDDPGDVLDAHGAVCDFLDRNSYQYKKTEEYSDFYDLILELSPDWLAADPKYVKDHIMPQAQDRTGNELREWLTEQLLSEYRYVNKPPEWIQSPEWPHSKSGPLVFLGQIDVNNYFHDLASVYVFHDQKTGECKSFVQCS